MTIAPSFRAVGLRWPLPAVATWLMAWALHRTLLPLVGFAPAAGAACVCGVALACVQRGRWRSLIVGAGFPLMLTAAVLPPWSWLPPVLLLLLVYPPHAWRDAPIFPTPAGALDALAERVRLPAGARILDAGCGAGHGLRALARAWPQARVEGIEWSRPLAAWARWACPGARVSRGDMWADGAWSGLALVYLFQRPESMLRAWTKAHAEMAPGSWLVSLEFAVPGLVPDLEIELPGGRPVLAWQVPPQSRRVDADNPQ